MLQMFINISPSVKLPSHTKMCILSDLEQKKLYNLEKETSLDWHKSNVQPGGYCENDGLNNIEMLLEQLRNAQDDAEVSHCLENLVTLLSNQKVKNLNK